jgi:glyoxylase I family protein
VRTLEELKSIRGQLDSAGISHSGIKIDHYGRKEFIWLDDPDGMRIEFYLRPCT